MSATAAAVAAPPVRRRARAAMAPAPLVPAAAGPVTTAHNGGPGTVTPEMKAKLADYVGANAEKNAANRRAEAAKKELHRLMGQGEVECVEETIGGKTYAATITAGETVAVDVKLLRKLVDDETFMKIISATQSAVQAHVGSNLLAKCTITTPKDKALSIGEKK